MLTFRILSAVQVIIRGIMRKNSIFPNLLIISAFIDFFFLDSLSPLDQENSLMASSKSKVSEFVISLNFTYVSQNILYTFVNNWLYLNRTLIPDLKLLLHYTRSRLLKVEIYL